MVKQSDEAILENKWEKKPQLMLTLPSHEQNLKSPDQQGILWVLEFDGSVNKLGAGAGVWIHNKEKGYATGKAYRLNFRCTNNMAEYEALLLGLKIAKSLQAPSLSIMGDSDLVIQQVKGNFVTNDKRLRSYRSAVIEILETFLSLLSQKFQGATTSMHIAWQHLPALSNSHWNLITVSQLRSGTDPLFQTMSKNGKYLRMTCK
jgi:ribonuclease HI